LFDAMERLGQIEGYANRIEEDRKNGLVAFWVWNICLIVGLGLSIVLWPWGLAIIGIGLGYWLHSFVRVEQTHREIQRWREKGKS